MGDYDYSCYSLQKTGVAPFGHAPFYNSSILWSYKPSMTSSPPSSVIMTSAYPASRRQAMSEVGMPRGLHRSDTSVTTRSMPLESDKHSAPWYQKTKQALVVIPVMFEARANKDSSRDLDRYNRWQPKDIHPNPTVQYLSLPAKPVSVFQASRSQAANNPAPSQRAFHKHKSADGLNQRQNPSASTSSASVLPSDGFSADSQSANSRVLLKASPISNNTSAKFAQSSSNPANPRFVAEHSSPVRRNAETARPAAEYSFPRPVVDPSVVQKSGVFLKHTAAPSRPSENALGRRPFVDSPSAEDPRHSRFPSPSLETGSKDYSAEPQGKIKFNPLFENDLKDQVKSNLSSAVTASPRAEVGLNRHLAGPRIRTDGVRDGRQQGAKVNEKSTSTFDEKEIIKDAFRFLDDFDD